MLLVFNAKSLIKAQDKQFWVGGNFNKKKTDFIPWKTDKVVVCKIPLQKTIAKRVVSPLSHHFIIQIKINELRILETRWISMETSLRWPLALIAPLHKRLLPNSKA